MKFFSYALAAATVFIAGSIADQAQGCFSSELGLLMQFNNTDTVTSQFNSRGKCGTDTCTPAGYPVFAMSDKFTCWCGSELPPASSKVSNSSCNIACPGYPQDTCGGIGFVSVYLGSDTLAGTIGNINDDGTSTATTTGKTSPSATTSSKPSVVTVNGVTQTVTAASTASANSKSGGASKAGIAAGVVVGLIAIAAIAGGVYLFIRNKRRREVEEEYRRNAAVSSFMNGSKHPTSSGAGSFGSDMRLDPAVMAQRRMSDGSIADNQDYSRRILKVTNA